MTNVSKVYFSLSRVCEPRGAPARGGRSCGRRVGRRPEAVPIVRSPAARAAATSRVRPAGSGRRTPERSRRCAARVAVGRGPLPPRRRSGGRRRRCAGGGRRSGRPGGSGTSVPPDGRRRVDDDREVDRDAEVAGQRLADRPAQDPLDGVLGELARRGEQRGAVDEAERPGQAQEGALLRRTAWRAPDPADAPERSAITRSRPCPRSPGWSATGRAPLRCRPRTTSATAVDDVVRAESSPQTCPHLCARRYAGAQRPMRSRARAAWRRGSERSPRIGRAEAAR